MQNREIVKAALQDIISNPLCNTTTIERYFSPSYTQHVDGKTLHYNEFIQHIALLHSVLKTARIDIIAIAAEANSVFTHHHVFATKKEGTQIHMQVMAHFILDKGKITECNELTRTIIGSAEDHDLGSRV